MSDDRVHDSISELFDSRKDHEGRIMVMESTIKEIRKDQSLMKIGQDALAIGQAELKKEIQLTQEFVNEKFDMIREFNKETINKMESIRQGIQKVNGLPQENKDKISDHDRSIHQIARNVQDINEDISPVLSWYKNTKTDIRRILVILIASAILGVLSWFVFYVFYVHGIPMPK